MKACRSCNQHFEPTAWQIAKSDYECVGCRRLRQAAYRAQRKENGNPVISGRSSREYHRAYRAKYFQSEVNRERRNALMRAYRKVHTAREHCVARWQVHRALRTGRLTRQPCEVCGAEKVHAHHDDYSRPLEVRWLCPAHHREIHAKATGVKP